MKGVCHVLPKSKFWKGKQHCDREPFGSFGRCAGTCEGLACHSRRMGGIPPPRRRRRESGVADFLHQRSDTKIKRGPEKGPLSEAQRFALLAADCSGRHFRKRITLQGIYRQPTRARGGQVRAVLGRLFIGKTSLKS